MVMGSKVQVYRNLHKKCWSVRDKKSGRVITHADTVSLRDCKFHVGEKGRQRVLKDKCKNVHAWIEGTLTGLSNEKNNGYFRNPGWVQASYNPYKYPDFMVYNIYYRSDDLLPIHVANKVFMKDNGRVMAQVS